MVITHSRPRRKISSGRYIAARKKRLFERGREPTLTRIDQKIKIKTIRTKAKGTKQRLLRSNMANLYDPKSKTYTLVEIKTVVENLADRHYVRRNIVTKGAIVETKKGKAKITSRPGQDGMMNAILVAE